MSNFFKYLEKYTNNLQYPLLRYNYRLFKRLYFYPLTRTQLKLKQELRAKYGLNLKTTVLLETNGVSLDPVH